MHADLVGAAQRRILRTSVLLVMVSALAADFVPTSASAQSIMDRLKAAAQQSKTGQPAVAAKPKILTRWMDRILSKLSERNGSSTFVV
jgi:hypothetical protein